MTTHYHTLKDGRTLAYCDYGTPDGHPIFYAHGSPGSRLEGQGHLFPAVCQDVIFETAVTEISTH